MTPETKDTINRQIYEEDVLQNFKVSECKKDF